jgi:hypothetical protein
MANVEPDSAATATPHEEEHHEAPPPNKGLAFLAWLVRTVARVWVIGMMVVAAGFGGIAVYQFYQSRAELAEVQQAPGDQSYAVVAYRRELARQIEAYSHDWENWEAVPQPPSRPRLMEEIDIVRARNAEIAREQEQRRSGSGRSTQVAAPL